MTQHFTAQYKIFPRAWNFDFTKTTRHWVDNSAYLTHMFNAPSILTPYVEVFLNFTVINVLDKVEDKDLKLVCQAFVKQESQHSREHIKYNIMLDNQGYACREIVNSVQRKLDHIKNKWSPLSSLAVTVGIECLTTILCKSILEENILTQNDKSAARFWKWHFMEELEHKSVVMDVYSHLGGGYLRRISLLTLVLVYYCYYIGKIYIHLLRIDNKSISKGIFVTCFKRSFFRKSLLQLLSCFRYHFHPRQIKTEDLLNLDLTYPDQYVSINKVPRGYE